MASPLLLRQSHASSRGLPVSPVLILSRLSSTSITTPSSSNASLTASSKIAQGIIPPEGSKKGPGGRSSDSGQTVTVFGATGYLGRYLVNRLGRTGSHVVLPYRGVKEDMRHLKLMCDLGQVTPLKFDVRDERQVAESVRHSDVVYNLIGRDYETKNFTFNQVNVEAAQRIARICREEGVSRLVHVSALNARPDSKSSFLRTKAQGEAAVLEEFPSATIVRPSTIFGYEDRFFNRMGWFATYGPLGIFPIVNGGMTKMRPVFAPDVGAGLFKIMEDNVVGGVYEFAGPREYYYRSLVDFFLDICKRDVRVLNLPEPIATTIANLHDKTSIIPVITGDEVTRLTINDTLRKSSQKLSDLGIVPSTVEDQIIKFARLYRPNLFQHASFEEELKVKRWI